MANGRKSQKVATTSSAGSSGVEARGSGRKRWPGEGTDDAASGGGAGSDDLVSIVRGLAQAVAEHDLSELIVDTPEVTFTLRRGGTGLIGDGRQMPAHMHAQMPGTMPMPAMAAHHMPSAMPDPGPDPRTGAAIAAAAASYQAVPVDDKSHVVTSPFVGTFYRRSNPDSPEYVKLNDRVRKGQVLCIVEAMKLMNEIEADIDGTIVGILAEDSAPVEYGQQLFKIAP